MNSGKLKRMNLLHSWTGIITGLFVFVVCFSGTVALFYEELATWENPQLRSQFSEPPQVSNRLIDEFYQRSSQMGTLQQVVFQYPSPQEPFFKE